MRVTICIPCKNVAAFVRECLLSVLNQDFDDIEILVLLASSIDDTEAIVSEIERNYRGNKLLKVQRDVSGGMGVEWRTALMESTGDYIGWLGGDDFLYDETSISTVVQFLAEFDQVDIAAFSCIYVDENGTPMEKKQARFVSLDRLLNHSNDLPFMSLFVSRASFRRQNFYIDDYGNDLELLMRLTKGGAQVLCSDILISCFRRHSDSETYSHSKYRAVLWKDWKASLVHGGRVLNRYLLRALLFESVFRLGLAGRVSRR